MIDENEIRRERRKVILRALLVLFLYGSGTVCLWMVGSWPLTLGVYLIIAANSIEVIND